MASTDSTVVPERADHPACAMSAAAHAAATHVRKAVVRYKNAAARYDELIAKPAHTLTGAEFDSLALAQDTIAEAFGILAAAGQHHLVRDI